MSLKEVANDNRSRSLLFYWLPSGAFASCSLLPQQGWLRYVPITQMSPLRLAEVFCDFIFVLLRLWELGLSVSYPNVCFLENQSTREPKR